MYTEEQALSSVVNVTHALELARKPTTTKILAGMLSEALPICFSQHKARHKTKHVALQKLAGEVGVALDYYMMGLSPKLVKPSHSKSYDPRVTKTMFDGIRYYDLNGEDLLTIVHLEQFKDHLKSVRKLTDGSMYNYLTYIKEVPKTLGIQVSPDNVNKQSVEAVISQLKATSIDYSNTNSALRAYAEFVEVSLSDNLYPDEVSDEYTEGSVTTVTVNRYERDNDARTACIAHYGAVCKACNMDFGKTYGELGKGFIHVHHIKPLHTIGAAYKVDPIKDLIPLCPNCHAMIHKCKPILTVDELKGLIRL
jgi:5-methylcytosine-specific restriction protein A